MYWPIFSPTFVVEKLIGACYLSLKLDEPEIVDCFTSEQWPIICLSQLQFGSKIEGLT